jgi:hypothetical protein
MKFVTQVSQCNFKKSHFLESWTRFVIVYFLASQQFTNDGLPVKMLACLDILCCVHWQAGR